MSKKEILGRKGLPDIRLGYIGVGRYLPPHILTNQDLERMVETSDEWIIQRTGIKTRRIMGPRESVVSMATAAAQAALDHSRIDPHQIRVIRVGVNTHLRFPSLASIVEDQLGIVNISAADISAGCSAFIFAVEEIYHYLMVEYLLTGEVGYGLAIGVDGLSSIVNWKDRSTCVLFGDGAGAVVIGPVVSGGILATLTRTQGQYGDLLYLDDPILPALEDPNTMQFRDHNGVPYPFLHMEGRKVFQVAVRSMIADVKAVVEKYRKMSGEAVTVNDIAFVIPHQANHRIVSAVAEGLGIPMDRMYQEGIMKYGNTSSASIPIGYVDEWGKRPGALEIDVAFGSGFASGAILRRNPDQI